MQKYLVMESDNGTKYAVPVEAIARNRAAWYAEREFDGDVERSLKEDTIPLFEDSDYEIWDWYRGNMNPDEAQAILIAKPEPATPDEAFNECSEYEMIDELPAS